MSKVVSVENLVVFEKAYQASFDVHFASLAFPQNKEWSIAGQIRRSTKKICANLSERFAKQKYSQNKYKRFLRMTIRSCEECLIWIKYSDSLGYITKNQTKIFRESYKNYSHVDRFRAIT